MANAGLLLSLLVAASAPPPTGSKPKSPPKPPVRVALAPLAGAPFVGCPSFTPDDRRLLVARFGAAGGGQLTLVPLDAPDSAQAIDPTGASAQGALQARLSPDGKRIAALVEGELWLLAVPGSGADPAQPERIYPPKHGDAPLGPKLSHVLWAWDGSWLLLQSPLAWARLTGGTGELSVLPLEPVDLTGGSLLLGPDGVHAAFVRPTAGAGWVNGAKVIVLNLQTGQAQVVDSEHDYTEVAPLPDGQLLGKDAGGNLWVLRGHARVLYFQPPPLPGATAGQYVVSLDGSRLAFVAQGAKASQLYVGQAPPVPPWPKRGGAEAR